MALIRGRLAGLLDGPFDSPQRNFCDYFPLLFLPHFVFGMALGLLYLNQKGKTPGKWRWLFFPFALTLATLFLTHSKLPVWMFSEATLVPLFGGLIFFAAGPMSRPVSLVLGARPLVELGDASYALYILHVPLMFWWTKCERVFGLKPLASWVSLVGFCCVAVIISVMVCRFIERPARSWLLRRFRESKVASIPARTLRAAGGTIN
jgi:peptidoglycan/LPS O-acetylase OafA/YrhL